MGLSYPANEHQGENDDNPILFGYPILGPSQIQKGSPDFRLFSCHAIQSPSWGLHRAALDKLPQLVRSKKKGRNAAQSMASQWNDQSSDGFFGRCPPLNSGFPLGNELGSENTHFFRKTSCFAFQKVLVLTSTLVAQRLLCKSSQNLFCSTCGNKSESPWVIQWSNVAVTWSTIQVELELIQFSSNPLELNIPNPRNWSSVEFVFFCSSGITKIFGPIHPVHPSFYQRGGGSA